MNDEDLYGAPRDSSWLYAWPAMGGTPDTPEVAALKREIAAGKLARTKRDAELQAMQPQAQPAAATPAESFVSWQQFQAANSAADPTEVYDAYVNDVAPQQLQQRGFAPEIIEQATARFKEQNPRPTKVEKPKEPEKKTGFAAAGSELLGGLYSYAAGMAAIPAALGLGGEETYKRWKEKSDALRAESAAPGSFEEMKFGENFLPYLRQLAFGSLPYMLEFAAGAGLGSLALKGTRAAAREAARTALEVAARDGAESATSIAAQKAAVTAAEKLAGRVTTAGAIASYPSSVGQVLTAQDEQNKDMNAVVAAALGVPYAALNKFGMESLIGREIAGAGARTAIRNPLLRGSVEALKVGTSEAGQEESQQILEELGRAAVDPNYKIDAKVLARLKESAIGGALLGGIPGGVVGAIHRPAEVAPAPGAPPPAPAAPGPPTPPGTATKPEFVSDEELAKREAPPPAKVLPEEEPLLSPEERQGLYESMGVSPLDQDESIRTAVGLTGIKFSTKKAAQVDEKVRAVASADTTEAKMDALVDLANVVRRKDVTAAIAPLVSDMEYTSRLGPILDQYQGVIDPDNLVAMHVAQDLIKDIVSEQAQAGPAPEQGTTTPTQPAEVAAAAAAAEPGAKLKRGRKPRTRAAAAAEPAAVSTAPVEAGGQLGANAPVLPSLGQALAAATGGGERVAGLEGTPGKRRRGLKSAAAAAGGVAATDVEPGVPVGTAGAEGGRVTKPTFLRWLQEEKDISWGGFPDLPKTEQAQLRNEYGAIPGEIVGGLAAKKAAQQPGKVIPKGKGEASSADAEIKPFADVERDLGEELRNLQTERDQLLRSRTPSIEKSKELATIDRRIAEIKADLEVAALLDKRAYLKAVQRLVDAGRILKKDQKLYEAIATGDTKAALQFVERNSKNLVQRLVAKALREAGIVPRTYFASIAKKDEAVGLYYSAPDIIELDAGLYLQQAKAGNTNSMMRTLLHEVVHGGTVNALSKAFFIYSSKPRLQNATVKQKPDTTYAVFDQNNVQISPAYNWQERADAWVDDTKRYIQTEEYKSAERIFNVFTWLRYNAKPVNWQDATARFREWGISLDGTFKGGLTVPTNLRKWGTEEKVDPESLPAHLKELWWKLQNQPVDIYGAPIDFNTQYGSKNPLELVAEVLSNDNLQNDLQRIRLPKELTGGKLQDAWRWFIREIKKLLGIYGVPDNALEEVLRATVNVMRSREYATSPVTGNAYVPAYNERPATKQEMQGHQALHERYKTKTNAAVAEDKAAGEKADIATGKVQTGAITGHDPVTHERTHIAYKDKDTGTYRLYEVSDPNTAEGLRGDPDSRQDLGSREQVMDLLRSAGAEAIEHTREFVGGLPEDSVHRKVGWEGRAGPNGTEGILKYQANEQTDGTWKVYRSEDLFDRSKPTEIIRVNSYAEALQLYDGARFSKSERQAQVNFDNQQTRSLGQREFNPAHWLNRDLFDRQADLKRFGYQAMLEAEKNQQQIPDSQRLDYLATFKNSYAETEINQGLERTYQPLFAKGRELMKQRNWGAQLLSDLHTALVVNERFPKARLHFTPEVEAKYGKQHAADLKAAQDLLQQHAPAGSPARTALEAYAKQWKQAQNDVIDIRVRNRMLTPEVGERIKRAYTYYAPLGEGMPSLRKGSTGRSATGEQIYQKMVVQFTKAVTEGVDNNIKRQLANTVKQYVTMLYEGKPMIEVAPVLGVRRNLDTGAIEEYIDTAVMSQKSLFYYDENAQPMRMIVNYPPLLDALDSFPEQNRSTLMRKAMAGAAMFNYLYGTTKTVFSPVFGVVNFLRDNFTTIAQLDRDINYRTWLRSYLSPKVWQAAFLEGFAPDSKALLEGTGPVATFAREAMANGALINRKYRLGADELSRTVGYTLNPTLWGYTKQFGSLEGPLFNVLSGFTKTLENVTRMAVYDAGTRSTVKRGLAKGQPMSKIRAGIAAKNATVNFEPKGDYAGVINPLYVFANARMQGLRTLGMNLGFQPGGQTANLRTQVGAGMAVAMGLFAGWMLWSNSEKDPDKKKRAGKIPDYKRDSMLIFDEKVPGIPMPQELGAFYVLGNSLMDALVGDKHDKGPAAAARFVTNMIQNFWPSGSAQYDPIGYNASTADYAARMFIPTPFMLLYDTSTNRTTFGSEIVRNKERLLKQGIPLSEMGGPKTSPLAVSAARGTAQLTGFESAPQQWEYVAKQLVAPQINLYNWITGAEPRYEGQRTNPFAARFMPDVSKYADRESYDEAKTDVENAYQKWKRADPADREAIRKQYEKLIRIRPEMHTIDGQIDKLFQGVRKMSPEQRAEKYKQADKRAEELRTKALKRYYEATE